MTADKLNTAESNEFYEYESYLWDSALIKGTSYFPKEFCLVIEFSNGAVYLYHKFSRDLYDEFVAAESKGKFFLTNIKKNFTTEDQIERLV